MKNPVHTPAVPGEHETEGMPPRPGPSRRAWWIGLGLLAVLSTLRLWFVELDPPEQVVPYYRGEAHFRDEAAKAHEARNKAKFGRWSLSEADEYGFWRAQSPAWVWGEAAWFSVFGVGIAQARMFVIVQTIVALALLIWLALIRHGLPAAVATGMLLGFNWAYLVYSRLALMEGALICWLMVATAALSQLERRPDQAARWTMVAVVGMLIACTIKQTGLLLVPAFAVALPWLGLRAAARNGRIDDGDRPWKERLRARLRRREGASAVVGVAVLVGVLAMLILSPEYQERLAFNATHFTAAGDNGSIWRRATRLLLRGFFSRRLQMMFNLLAPLCLYLATLELVRIVWVDLVGPRARRAWARRQGRPEPRSGPAPGETLEQGVDPLDWWMLAWGVLALLANLASPHRAIRFQLVLLPPAAWLAGALVGRAWVHDWSTRWAKKTARIGLLLLAIGGVGLTMTRFAIWMRTCQPTVARIGGELEEVIGDRHAVVVGEYAAQAVFETDYWHFYVRPSQFNTDPEILEAFGITHVVFEPEGDFVEKLFEKRGLLVGRRELGQVQFRERTLTVWELASAERRAEIEAEEAEAKEKEKEKRERAKRRKANKKARTKAKKRRGKGRTSTRVRAPHEPAGTEAVRPEPEPAPGRTR